MRIPEEWKSSRHRIVEVYIIYRSPVKVARILDKDLSYVSRVLRSYKDWLEKEYDRPESPPQVTSESECMPQYIH